MNDAPHTGPDRVPPGQYTTDKWPILTYGGTPRVDPETWTFRISGLVAAERVFSWQEFQALPRVRITADFHCVTRFSTLDNGWEGVATRELLKHVEPLPEVFVDVPRPVATDVDPAPPHDPYGARMQRLRATPDPGRPRTRR